MVASLASAQTSGPVQYVYDELGRLIAVIDANGNAAVYNYDAVGNILSIARYNPTQIAIFSFTPGQGPVGASVTISGIGFSTTPSQNTVTFNGTAATVASATANQLVVNVPVGATSGAISVTAPGGSATSSSSFVVTSTAGAPTITGFTPSVGRAGDPVTINGTNFDPVPANNLTPVVEFFTDRFARRYRTAAESIVRTEAWYGYGPSRLSGDARIAPESRAAAIDRYYRERGEVRPVQGPLQPVDTIEHEADLVWMLIYIKDR